MATKELRFSYILKTLEGEIIDIASPDNPLVFVDGEERFIPGLEAVLRTLGPGEKRTIQLAAADAYGERDPSLVQAIRRELLPPVDLEPGAVFRAGEDVHDPIVTVVSIDGDEVTLDGNHPLAGMDLVFEIETF
jgi:FKBP-type peptidyl-prolyl cis-trans isomerase SlyD